MIIEELEIEVIEINIFLHRDFNKILVKKFKKKVKNTIQMIL
jgi:hypothetical protein